MTNISQHFKKIFAKRKNRVLLWLFFIFILLLSVNGIYFEHAQNLENVLTLSNLINFIEIFLIIGALLIFIYTTNKSEELRAESNVKFYRQKYFSEEDRWIAFQKNKYSLKGYVSYKESVQDNGDSDLLLSKSVKVHVPSSPISIKNIDFEVSDDEYELPWFVAEQASDLIITKYNTSERYEYNGRTIALRGFNASSQQLNLKFIRSNYYNHLLTNCLPDVESNLGVTFRDMLEPGPKLNRLEDVLVSNHLGMSCLIITSDEHFVLPLRSQNTNIFRGRLSPTISGASNASTCFDEKLSQFSALAWLNQEAKEELTSLDLRSYIDSAVYLGLSRELIRTGKPEMFFSLKIEKSKNEISQFLFDQEKNQTIIDYQEYDKFLILPINEVRTNLCEIWGNYSSDVGIKYKSDTYKLSESLVVNLYFYLAHYG